MGLRFATALFAGVLLVPWGRAQGPAQTRTDSLGDPLPDGAIARLGTTRFKHDPGVGAVVTTALFTPDGKKLVSMADGVGRTGRTGLHLWDVPSGKDLPGPWRGYQEYFYTAIAYSPDSAILAGARIGYGQMTRGDSGIVLWDVAAAKALRTMGFNEQLTALAFTDGGKTLLSAGVNGTVRWWDVATGKEQRSARPFYAPADKKTDEKIRSSRTANTCSFSPDAKYLAILSQGAFRPTPEGVLPPENEIVVLDLAGDLSKVHWRVKTKENTPIKGVLGPRFHNPIRLAFSADSKRVALALGPDKVELRDVKTGKLIGMPPLDAKDHRTDIIGALALSCDGSTMAISGREAHVVLWDPNDPKNLRKLVGRMAQSFQSISPQPLTFSPDNKTLLVGADSDLQLYDVATLKEVNTWDGHRAPVEYVSFTGDSKRVLSGSAVFTFNPLLSREVVAWDAATWNSLKTFSNRAPLWPNIGVSSPESTYYVGKKMDDRFNLYDMATGKLVGRFSVPKKQQAGARSFFSPGSKFYVLFGQDDQGKDVQRLYAVPSCKLLCLLPPMTFEIEESRPIAFSDDDKLVALVSRADGQIIVLETATGKVRHRVGSKLPKLEQQEVFFYFPATLAFSPDGKLLASWHMLDNVIRVWEMTTGKERMQIPPPPERAGPQFAFNQFGDNMARFGWSPDGRTLAVGGFSERGKIQLWEVATKKIRREFTGHDGQILDLAFSPDGRLLASGSGDTTVLIWDVWGQRTK